MADVVWRAANGRAVAQRGDLVWSGTVDGGVVKRVVPLPGSDDAVVLLDPDSRPEGVLPWHPFANVVRIGPGGAVRWRAELVPQETAMKCWVDVDWADGYLDALAFSWRCQLDPATGRITHKTFTK